MRSEVSDVTCVLGAGLAKTRPTQKRIAPVARIYSMADPQQDAPVPIVRVSSGSSSASSARVLPGERSQYPVNMAVDFTRLRVRGCMWNVSPRMRLQVVSLRRCLGGKQCCNALGGGANRVAATFATVCCVFNRLVATAQCAAQVFGVPRNPGGARQLTRATGSCSCQVRCLVLPVSLALPT